jgi:hypothetical protein
MMSVDSPNNVSNQAHEGYAYSHMGHSFPIIHILPVHNEVVMCEARYAIAHLLHSASEALTLDMQGSTPEPGFSSSQPASLV